jgi:hypothetical protein
MSYKLGTKCVHCRRGLRLEEAPKMTAVSRSSAVRKLHVLAAKRYQQKITATTQWFNDKALAEDVVRYLNVQIKKDEHLSTTYFAPPRNGITQKWLSRGKNREGIEAALGDLHLEASRR